MLIWCDWIDKKGIPKEVMELLGILFLLSLYLA